METTSYEALNSKPSPSPYLVPGIVTHSGSVTLESRRRKKRVENGRTRVEIGQGVSRYGQTATVFNGPVRRWKKRWVHVSSSSPSLTYQSPHSQSNNNGNNSRLVLCRWTAISPANSPAEPAAAPDEPPRRKFRYTPVSVVEEHKKGIQKKVGDAEKTSEVDESVTPSDEMHGKPNIGQIMKEQDEELDENQSGLQDSNRSHLDLDLGLKGHSSNLDLIVQMKKGSSERFWLD